MVRVVSIRDYLRPEPTEDDHAVYDIAYCEGCSDGAVIGRLEALEALARDAAGAQYAVAILSGCRVVAYAEIAWDARFARCWRLDSRGRRWRRIEYRRLPDGRLHCMLTEEWDYLRAAQTEFDTTEGHRCWRFDPDGRADGAVDHRGGGGDGRHHDIDPAAMTLDWHFGDWAALCSFDNVILSELPDPDPAIPTTPPWRPPRPLRPHLLTELFTPGTRFELDEGERVTTELHGIGAVHLRNGRLAISDPTWLHDPAPWLTLAPGRYSVELAVVRFDDPSIHPRVAAARLVVSRTAIASWEMALREGEDPAFLDDESFFGFGVDSGVAGFLDPDAAPAIRTRLEDNYFQHDADPTELPIPGLKSFRSGWGDGVYPVWLGRDAAGNLGAVVADFLIAHHARILTRTPIPAR
ncbi:DUF4241 domain-containing protein [Nocardia sp. NPDC051570]|uniref:DUF4241 domain-containing protein n=1 Tax=Nocardia sp. NPDC051570 TaxID=3364324 RepID=UPI0037995B77